MLRACCASIGGCGPPEGSESLIRERRPPLAVGDCFGEIALLRGVPRTATVVADQPLRTLSREREAFLFAVTGSSVSSAAADELVTQRLTADSE